MKKQDIRDTAIQRANAGALHDTKQALANTTHENILEAIGTWTEMKRRFGRMIPKEIYKTRLEMQRYFTKMIPKERALKKP